MTMTTRRAMLAAKALTVFLTLTALAVPAAAQSDYPFGCITGPKAGPSAGSRRFRAGNGAATGWMDRFAPASSPIWIGTAMPELHGPVPGELGGLWRHEHQADFCKLKNVYMLNEGFRWD